MRARLFSSRPPWWLAAVPWIAAIALGYVLVLSSSTSDESLVALAYSAALTSAMLAVAPLPGGREAAHDVELELGARHVRLGRMPWAARIEARDVLGLRVNLRPACHEVVIDLGRGGLLVLEVDGERATAALVDALGGQRAATNRVRFATGTPPSTREARAVAVTSIGLLVSSALAGALGATESHVLVVFGVSAALYATARGLASSPSRPVALDPRALHTPKARISLETITRVEEDEDHVRVETARDGAAIIPVEVGTMRGDVTAYGRSLLARSIACAARERRSRDLRAAARAAGGGTASRASDANDALARHLRRGGRSAREWLSSLDALAARARMEGVYRATVEHGELEALAADERSDDELRFAAARVLYRIAPEVPPAPTQREARLLRVATDDDDEALDALAAIARRKAWL